MYGYNISSPNKYTHGPDETTLIVSILDHAGIRGVRYGKDMRWGDQLGCVVVLPHHLHARTRVRYYRLYMDISIYGVNRDRPLRMCTCPCKWVDVELTRRPTQ